ncbi:uncharacterized protein HMPREF1541_02881 [Cyphellophora europaea CBS 101466]|uniref:PH domain-containing protein n=1 Tax=Cyphellophora europaea (strain CBS 101466) TaxID=1220924 RepID=W2S4V5_CYPE1|nr:uncharacterized protein HMPREF1541_02881 [Cyphellophora europaea CBS 101466]ETN43722.1 hypothetical protein HMPREF1541_02881 [Cyphellophora europaea CBS 101466]
MEANSTAANPAKFSRYRTVRARAATLQTLSSQSDTDPPPPPLPKAATFTPAGPETAVKRAPSRYRRNHAAVEAPPVPTVPVPKIYDGHATAAADANNVVLKQGVTSPARYHHHHPHTAADPPKQHQQEERSTHTVKKEARRKDGDDISAQRGPPLTPPTTAAATSGPSTGLGPEERYDAAREEARMILEGEYDRLQKMRAGAEKQRHMAGHAIGNHAPDMSRRKDTVKHREQRSPRLDRGPERRAAKTSDGLSEAEPIQQQSQAPEPVTQMPVSPPMSPKRGLKRFIIGSPRQETPTSPLQANAPPATITSPIATHSSPPRFGHIDPPSAPHAHVQHFDAPISASNAPDRCVTVRYLTSEITLPVTPATTTKDLLNSASIVLSKPPDPRTATLVESYTTPTLELDRPLRRYERIRDVLNSWDADTQQHLLIVPAEESNASGLDLQSVPASAGVDITLQMYHAAATSSTRGTSSWHKRWVRLQPNGQISISKHESGVDSTNICHLSDFDLYAPGRSLLKRLRPPRGQKSIFAVKSLQKSAMFLDDDSEGGGGGAKVNFAHFFAAGDKGVADRWYAAVHGWRSWYLVNVLGEGRVPASGTGEVLGEVRQELTRRDRDGAAGNGHDGRPGTSASAETVPYQLGSFKSLLEMDFSKMGTEESVGPVRRSVDGGSHRLSRRSIDFKAGGSPKRPHTARAAPPTAFPGRFIVDSIDGNSSSQDSSSGFTGKGLLAQNLHSTATGGPIEDTSLGFTGKGLLARSATQRSQGGRGTGRGVSVSGLKKGQPLVDLSGQSEFADGSLLRKLEAWKVQNGEAEMKVDREKRVEGNMRVGEGY